MIKELLKVLNLLDNSSLDEHEKIIKNNKYKKLKKYCQYAKSKKNTEYYYCFFIIFLPCGKKL
jgi:hypothetical protein